MTLPPGSVVVGNAPIPLRIRRTPRSSGDASVSDSLLVEILDSDGEVLADQRFESVETAEELPPVAMPVLPDGLYRVRTTYFDGADVVVTSTVPVFLLSRPFRITGLTAFPASSFPEAEGLLSLALDIPRDADPFVVWYLDGAVVAADWLSVTGLTLTVTAPATAGVFRVRVDLYPYWDDDADYATVPAPEVFHGELVVTRTPAPSATDLSPWESYFSLYHFRGTLRESGVRGHWLAERDFTGRVIGRPALAVDGDIFGYRLDAESAIALPGVVWPAYDGALSPVSLAFRLAVEDPVDLTADAVLLRMEGTADELLTVLIDPAGRVGVLIGPTDETLWSATPLLAPSVATDLTITLLPEDEALKVSYYVGGKLASTRFGSPVDPGSALRNGLHALHDQWGMAAGVTTIGGGFTGIIDEFGVYFRNEWNEPAANTELFEAGLRAEHGDRLVFATAFESTELPAGLLIEGTPDRRAGSLLLGGGSVTLPSFALDRETFVVEIGLLPPALLAVDVYDRDPDPSLPTAPQATVLYDTGTDGGPSVRLSLRHDGDSLVLTGLEEARTIAGWASPGRITLRLRNAGSPGEADTTPPEPVDLVLTSIAAWRERLRAPSAGQR